MLVTMTTVNLRNKRMAVPRTADTFPELIALAVIDCTIKPFADTYIMSVYFGIFLVYVSIRF